MNYLKLMLFICLVSIMINVNAQENADPLTFTGTIIDQETNEPIVGAYVACQKPAQATITNALGGFTLKTNTPCQSFKISALGFKTFVTKNKEELKSVQLLVDTKTLDHIVVTANRQQTLKSEIPASIGLINTQLIKETNPNTMDQVLNKLPGVFVADLGNEQHMTSIRQPISTKSLFLYLEDGLPTRPSGVFQHNAFNELNQGMIKSIEVIRGPAASTYGADAVGGAINFITFNPTTNFSGNINARVNSNGLRRTDIRLSNTYGKTGIIVGGYYAFRNEGFTEHSSMRKYAFTAKVINQLSPKTDLNTSITLTDHDTDMTGSLTEEQFFGKAFTSAQTFTERTVDALRIQSTLNHDWNDKSKTSVRLAYRDNTVGQIPSYRVRTNRTTGVVSGTINAAKLKSYVGVIQHTQKFNWQNLEVIAGATFDSSPTSFFEDYIVINQSDEGINLSFQEVDSTLTRNEIDIFNIGAYVKTKIDFGEKVTLLLATRFDQFVYNHRNFLEPSSFSGSPNSKDVFTAWAPKVGLTYNPRKDIRVYGNISRAFLPPQTSELYQGVNIPVLEPSVFVNYEIGGSKQFKFSDKAHLNIDLSLYHLNSENQIITVRDDDGTSINKNVGKSTSRGIEYGFNFSFTDQIFIRWSGSAADHIISEDTPNSDFEKGKHLPFGANLIMNWEIGYAPKQIKGFKISIENQIMGPYYMDITNENEYEGFRLFNMRVNYKFKQFQTTFSIMNLTDELWSTRAAAFRWGKRFTPGIPRTFQINMAYQF